jgi:hypothetical protein
MSTFTHPVRGLLCFEQVTFNLSSRPEFKLVMLVETQVRRPIYDRHFNQG